MQKAPVNEQLAVIYGTSERQIRRWQAENAPLFDVGKMGYFWASRRTLPMQYVALTDAQKRTIRRQLRALASEHPEAVL